MMVSAVDHYVHDLSRLGIIEVFEGKRPATDALLRFEVFVSTLMRALGGMAGTVLLEAEVRERHSFQSFQQPDRIADAVRLFSTVELWNSVASEMNEEPQVLKARIRLLVERRNKIAHEADADNFATDSGLQFRRSCAAIRDCENIDAAGKRG